MRLEKETFGPVLRAARERRGISLDDIAAETKLAVELWADLEDNNLARWPRRIYARSYIRDYAERVGLDAEEVVNDFCRLFPEWGDRRAEQTIRHQAAIVNHDLSWEDLPNKMQRRASDRATAMAPSFFGRHKTRILASAIDLAAIATGAWAGVLLRFSFWPSLAVAAIGYNAAATLLSPCGFGMIASEWLVRVIAAFPVSRRRLVSRTGNA